MYKIKTRVIPINSIHKSQIIEVLPKEKFLKVVEFLYLKNVQPLKEINDLYNELRECVY